MKAFKARYRPFYTEINFWLCNKSYTEDPRLLGCYTLSLGAQFSSFPWIVIPLSSGSSRRLEPPNVDDKDYNHSKLRKLLAKGYRVTSQNTWILSYTVVNLKPHYTLKWNFIRSMTVVSIARASPLCRLSFQLRKTIWGNRQNMPSRLCCCLLCDSVNSREYVGVSVARHVRLSDTSGRRRPSQRHNYAAPLGRDIEREQQARNLLDLQSCFINT